MIKYNTGDYFIDISGKLVQITASWDNTPLKDFISVRIKIIQDETVYVDVFSKLNTEDYRIFTYLGPLTLEQAKTAHLLYTK